MKIDFVNALFKRQNLKMNFNSIYSKELINRIFDTVIYTNGVYKDYKNNYTYDVTLDKDTNVIHNINIYRKDDKFWVDILSKCDMDNISITEVIENNIIIRYITFINGFKYSIETYIYEDVVECLKQNNICFTIEKINETGIIPDYKSEFVVHNHVLYNEYNKIIKKVDSYTNLIKELVKVANLNLIGYDYGDVLSKLYVEETKKEKEKIILKKH